MDEATARWYVEHTGGQFQTLQMDGHWYLHTPDHAGTAQPAPAVEHRRRAQQQQFNDARQQHPRPPYRKTIRYLLIDRR
jgi:hypothetical protein